MAFSFFMKAELNYQVPRFNVRGTIVTLVAAIGNMDLAKPCNMVERTFSDLAMRYANGERFLQVRQVTR